MASNAGGSIITIGILGGLGYYLYSSGLLSSLFGSSAAPATGGTPAVGTNPVPTAPNPVAPVTPPACSPSNILAPLLAKVRGLPGGSNYGPNMPGTYNIDEWGYYMNQMCSGMADQYGVNADTLFPGAADRGGPLNWSAFAGYAGQKGLSAVPRRRLRRTPRMIGTNMVRRVA